VDGADDINRLLSWGVDGVITDRPDIALAVRDEWRRRRATEVASPTES
jgi:glycerophosphoryl diester phosphodiesterase